MQYLHISLDRVVVVAFSLNWFRYESYWGLFLLLLLQLLVLAGLLVDTPRKVRIFFASKRVDFDQERKVVVDRQLGLSTLYVSYLKLVAEPFTITAGATIYKYSAE